MLVISLLGAAWLLTSGDADPANQDDLAVARPDDTVPAAPTFENDIPVRSAEPLALEPTVSRVFPDIGEGRARIGGPEGGIYGRTLDRAGQPIEGVTISLYLGNALITGTFPGAREAVDVTAVSDAGGRFRLVDVPVDKSYVVVGEHDDYAKSEVSNIAVRQGKDTGEIELRMTEGAQVCGIVKDSNSGVPISGARVELFFTLNMVWQKPEDQKPWKVVFTNGAGHFCFTHVSEPSIKVRVAADGYETLTIPKSYALETKPRDENLEFKLSPGRSLPGTVVTIHGHPVPNARIEATGQAGEFISNSVAYSDDGGHFLLDGMGEGRYQVRATCEGYSDKTVPRVTTSAGHIQINMIPRGGVEGWVASVANQPVTSFTLHLLRNHPSAGPNYLNKNRSFSDPDGYFLFDDLDSGDYVLEVRAEGYADARSDPFSISQEANAPAQVRMTMARGGTLAGTVTSPTGEAVSGALVSINPNNHVESQIGRIFRQLAPSDERMRKQRTGIDGKYEFEHIPSSTYQVGVEHDQHAPRTINDVFITDDDQGGNNPLDIQLPPGAVIAGRATSFDSTPLAFCKVQISQPGVGYMDAGTTDADGRFEFSNLREGNYQITVNPERVNGEAVHPFVRLVYAQKSMVEIYVSEGQVRPDVTLQLRER
jgi:hypothetical protein